MAIVSDVHGNRTALEAVVADLRDAAPDLILHGGDLADFGASPGEVVDRIRDLGWPGVLGNTDEVHVRPQSLEEFAAASAGPASLWAAVRKMAAFTHELLGQERIDWLGALPRVLRFGELTLVHATPADLWRAPAPEASSEETEEAYSKLGGKLVVFGHIHLPFVRVLRGGERIVANSGSVGLPYDGDPRASYLLIDDGDVTIRRVEYDVEKEIQALANSGLPQADWIAQTLRTAALQMP